MHGTKLLYPLLLKNRSGLFIIILTIGLFLPATIYHASDNRSKIIQKVLAYTISDQNRSADKAKGPSQNNRYLHIRAKKSEHLFHPIIVDAASRYQLDPTLIKAVIMAESGYNPKAVSKKGAKGLMQLMPETAEALGVKDSFNPEHNIHGGVRYLSQLVEQFNGNVKLALAAYNAGSRKVKMYRGVPPFKATRYYIKKVFDYQHIYKKLMAKRITTI